MSGKRLSLFLVTVSILACAGSWYLFRPVAVPDHGRQTTIPFKVPKDNSVSTTEPSISAEPPLPVPSHQLEPFSIALPSALSDADILRNLASLYRSGANDRTEMAITKGMLQDPAAKATAEWLALQAGGPLRLEWFAAFQAQYPDWPVTQLLRRRAETALLTSQVSDTIKSAFFASNPPLSAAGKLAWARLLASNGNKVKAAEIVRPVWRQEQLSKGAEQQIMATLGDLLTPGDHRARMIFLLSKQNWDAALRAADFAGENAVLIAKARIAAAQNSKKAEAAIAAIPKAQQSDPLVTFSRLLSLNQQRKYAEAAAVIVKLVPDSTPVSYPTPADKTKSADSQTDKEKPAGEKTQQPWPSLSAVECQDWKLQQRRVIRELLDANDIESAYLAASARLSEIGCTHDDAQFLAGWIALRFMQQPAKAKQHFEELAKYATTASVRARAAYWEGRVIETESGLDSAKPYYERAAREWTTFYGQLAKEKIPELALPDLTPINVPPDVRENFDNMVAVRAIRLLHAGGADELALPLYSELASQLPDETHIEALASLATEQRNPRALLSVAKTGLRRGFPLEVRAYPTFGIPDFSYAGKEIEAPLLYAIAHQESAFNPLAKSHAGALGLLQLMPETARTTASRFGVGFNLERLTTDPAYNAQLGAAHLDELLQNWRGSLILTFAAYNAGGGNVRKWIESHGDPRMPGVDPIDWIERIPFFETRHYVQRISENLMIYRALMKKSGPSIFVSGPYPTAPLPVPPPRELP